MTQHNNLNRDGIRKRTELFVLALLAVILIVLFFRHSVRPSLASPQMPTPPALQDIAEDVPEVTEHPVIQGGIHNFDELYAAINKYPNLYFRFDPTTARLVRLDHSICAHTSYRIGDSILWTKNCVLIKVGTLVWIDAQGHIIVARCGNLLDVEDEKPEATSDSAQLIPPIFAQSLAQNTPEGSTVPTDLIPPPDGSGPPNIPPSFPPIVPPYFPPVGGPCCTALTPTPPQPPIETPEPGVGELLVIGFIAIGAFGLFGKRI